MSRESQKNILFRKLVQRRAILNDPNEAPPEFLRSELLELMLQSCDDTGVIVVQGNRGVGKSTAARFLVKNSAGGIMFSNCQSTSTRCYWKGVAQAVGSPAEVYENDSKWETLLVEAVAAAKSPDELDGSPSWTDRLFDGILSTGMCGGGGGTSTPSGDDAQTIEGLDLSPLKSGKRALLVFDDFNDVQDDNILFMKHLFPIVEGQGVLAFVLVRDEGTANRLLALNGWGRISPLEGICKDISKAHDKEKIPQWRTPKWTKTQLEALIRLRYGDDVDTGRIVLEDESDGNPFDVLRRARKQYNSTTQTVRERNVG
jgi:hypothetical protein